MKNISTKKIAKNYIYNSFYQILILIAPLITTPYVSRVLGVTGIGVYNYTRSIATYFVLIGAVGTTLYGQREIAYSQNDAKEYSKVFWEITIFRFVTVSICTLIFFLSFGRSNEYGEIYRILGLEVFATAFDISWFFMGIENFRLTVIRNTIIKIIGVVLVFFFVKSTEDVFVYTLCLTLPIFIGNISLWCSLPKYLVKTNISLLDIVKRIKPILILFLPQIATEIYTVLDKTMLGQLASGVDQVGYYTQSEKIVKLALSVLTSLGTVMLPAMSFAFAQGKMKEIISSIQKAFNFVFLLGFALLFGLDAIASNFVPFFFGPGYEPVVGLIIVISPIFIFIGMSNVVGRQYLLPTQKQNIFTISVVLGSVINVIMNFLLIRKYNAIGASIATVVAEFGVTAIQCWFVRKELPLKKIFLQGVKYFVLGAIMGSIVYYVGKVLGTSIAVLGIQIILGIVIYLIELFIVKDQLFLEGIEGILVRLKK